METGSRGIPHPQQPFFFFFWKYTGTGSGKWWVASLLVLSLKDYARGSGPRSQSAASMHAHAYQLLGEHKGRDRRPGSWKGSQAAVSEDGGSERGGIRDR